MKKHKVCVIGTGFMGRTHLEALRRLGSVDIQAVAGTSLEKARQLADAFAVDRATADYREIVNDPAIDAVHVCTPNALHFPIAEAALRAGKHVLCEKPLATSSSEARKLVSLAKENQLRNCTCHNLRFYPWCNRCAACARRESWVKSWLRKERIRRTGSSTTPTGTGESNPVQTALPG